MSEQTTTAKMPHERKTTDPEYDSEMTEAVVASCRYQQRDVTGWLDLEDYYRDLPVEEAYYAAIVALRRAAGPAPNAITAAMVALVHAAQARARQLAQQATLRAFDAGYNYAVEAITGKPPAEGKDGEPCAS